MISLIRNVSAIHRERYGDVGYAENVLYPGIPEVLQRLVAAGVNLAVCTSKRVDLAKKVLERFGLRSYFTFVCGADIGTEKWQQIQGAANQVLVGSDMAIWGLDSTGAVFQAK